MDSHSASVPTSGSLDVQNGSQCAQGSEPVIGSVLDPKERTSVDAAPGHLQSHALVREDAPSVNGKRPEEGGASQETGRRPITVKTGVPVLRSHPIRIKIVVPPRCKRPITNAAISWTKDLPPVLVSSVFSQQNQSHSDRDLSAAPQQADDEPAAPQQADDEPAAHAQVGKDQSQTGAAALTSSMSAVHLMSQGGVQEETTEPHVPLTLEGTRTEVCTAGDVVEAQEQTEPLDLSLPKKREVHCSSDHSTCHTSLIMEVDEFEGDGDRDLVEEDDDDEDGEEEERVLRVEGTDALEDRLLSPSFFSTSVFTSISAIEDDPENLLLIDDQGIPYTLSPDGLRLPQVGSDQATLLWSEDTSAGHSLDKDTCAAAAAAAAAAPPDHTNTTEASIRTAQGANAAPPPSSGASVPAQSIQILTNSSASAPLLLLSSSSSSPSPQLSSAPLSLPLSFTSTSHGASTPMFLLLSSVPPSPGGPISVVDPSSGQASPMASVSTSVSLPGTSAQVSALGPLLPSPSHPVVRLRASAPPVVLSGVNHVTSVLTSLSVPSSTPAAQHHGMSDARGGRSSSSESKPGCEAISAEKFSDENKEPSASGGSPLTLTSDLLTPSPEAKMDSGDPPTEHLPLDDHLYYTNMAAPPSPTTVPIIPCDKLDPLQALDPLSPAESPGNMGSRRVLYCQLCPRVFFYLSDLERHAITHSQKKPHVCQQCGKAFKRSSHLQRHKHIHTGQRNFVCTICAKRFREAGELQRHQRVHTGEKPYQCQLCHTRFAERNTLRRHTKRKHPYHQVAMEMLNERRDGGGGEASGVQEEEESAEWYSSTVSTLDNSESELET